MLKLVNVDQGGRMAEIFFNLYEAKTSLSRLVERAAAGEEIIIGKAGRPMARLVAYGRPAALRQPGGWEGRVRIGDDFDAPLPEDLNEAFGE